MHGPTGIVVHQVDSNPQQTRQCRLNLEVWQFRIKKSQHELGGAKQSPKNGQGEYYYISTLQNKDCMGKNVTSLLRIASLRKMSCKMLSTYVNVPYCSRWQSIERSRWEPQWERKRPCLGNVAAPAAGIHQHGNPKSRCNATGFSKQKLEWYIWPINWKNNMIDHDWSMMPNRTEHIGEPLVPWIASSIRRNTLDPLVIPNEPQLPLQSAGLSRWNSVFTHLARRASIYIQDGMDREHWV